MDRPADRPDLITAHLLGPSPRFGLLLRSSAPNNLPRLLLPPHLFQPSFLCLLCQPFFPPLLKPLLLPQIGLLLLLKPNMFGLALGFASLDFDEGWHVDSIMMIKKYGLTNGSG